MWTDNHYTRYGQTCLVWTGCLSTFSTDCLIIFLVINFRDYPETTSDNGGNSPDRQETHEIIRLWANIARNLQTMKKVGSGGCGCLLRKLRLFAQLMTISMTGLWVKSTFTSLHGHLLGSLFKIFWLRRCTAWLWFCLYLERGNSGAMRWVSGDVCVCLCVDVCVST